MITVRRLLSILLLTAASLTGHSAHAYVERVEVHERTVVAQGKSFGVIGPYLRIAGTLHYAVDPASDFNAEIKDLALAPRDQRGLITFSGDFVLLTPLDPARGNRRLLYDVTNRGGMVALGRFNDGSGRDGARSAESFGNGFLMEQGYTVLWTGWNWDVLPRGSALNIDLPVATNPDGTAITGTILSEIAVTEPVDAAQHMPPSSIGYPPVALDSRRAQLSVRGPEESIYQPLDRNAWRFARPLDALGLESAITDPRWITLDGGFEPGQVYRLAYQTRSPKVVGLGLAAMRDAMAFFRFETADATGNQNPLLTNGTPLPDATLVYGASQSGRVLNTMIWHGLHVDEQGRMAFDGAMIDIAGGGKGAFNFRFAQTSRHFSHDIDLDFATDFFPFTTVTTTDTVSGQSASLFDRARTLNAVPRVFIVNTSTEYWARSASLVHTSPDGRDDVTPDSSVRLYMLAGGQHVIGVPENRGALVHCRNPLDYRPVLRALLSHLDAWVTLDRTPPDSTYPRLDNETLVDISTYRERFPSAPFMRTPDGYLQPPRLDFGPRFESDGIADTVPPNRGPVYNALVPAPDEDGLDVAGIRMPGIVYPLGTYVGWNPQNAATRAPTRLSRWFGSFIPFARTVPERTDRSDPRPAITERYVSKADYLESYAEATLDLANRELILGMDINPMIERAGQRFDSVIAHSPNDESCAFLTAP